MDDLKTREAVITLSGTCICITDSDSNSVDFYGEQLPSVPGHEIFSLKKAKEDVKAYMNKKGYKFSTSIDEKRFNNYNDNMTVNIERI